MSSLRGWGGPLSGLAAGLLLALVTITVDRATGFHLVPRAVTGSPTAAQNLTSTIVNSVIVFISVVLTVLTVALQLAMGQFSPRIVSALLRDRDQQRAIALFGATVVFGIVTLTQIDDQSGHVPGVTLVTLYLLALSSIPALVLFVSRAGMRMRASGLIDLVGNQLHAEIDRRFPVHGAEPPCLPGAVPSPRAGTVVGIDLDGLVATAVLAGAQLELPLRMGDFVPQGAPLVIVHGADPAAVEEVAELVALDDERNHEDDPAYGFRKLVDIAVRSASDDPTTSVEAIHRIHEAMRRMAWRPAPDGCHCDAAGNVRVTVRVRTWADYVQLAFEEIRLVGARQPQIARRLRAVLHDLKDVAPSERHGPLDEQLALLDAAIARHFEEDAAIATASMADPQGIG